MIQYYSPNLYFKDLFVSIFNRNIEQKVTDFYKQYTGKKYVLITSSCRVALYLAYKSIGIKGSVITSPLICSTALEPILESGNKIQFVDLSKDSFNINLDLLPNSISKDVIAMQTTYFGGRPLDMDKLVKYKSSHNLFLIEDCAQGFGSKFKEKNLGQFGDIACFSLMKTAYGVSGGILATNNFEIYSEAKKNQDTFMPINKFLLCYRIVRNLLESYRSFYIGDKLYNFLLKRRPMKNGEDKFSNQLTKPSHLALSLFVGQMNKIDAFHTIRISLAKQLMEKLPIGWYSNFINNDIYYMVPTKFFVYSNNVDSKNYIERMNDLGIEAKHLQQKYHSYYQDSYASPIWENLDNNEHVFYFLHDKILSLPLFERMSDKDINYTIKCLNNE